MEDLDTKVLNTVVKGDVQIKDKTTEERLYLRENDEYLKLRLAIHKGTYDNKEGLKKYVESRLPTAPY